MSVLVAIQTLIRQHGTNTPVDWQRVALFPLAYWYGWALWTPLIFAAARRLPGNGRPGIQHVAAHLLLGLSVSLVMVAWYAALVFWIRDRSEGSFGTLFETYLARGFHYDVLTYAAILGAGFTSNFRALYHERARRALQLENSLIQSQLEVLRMQLRPHFLFNTLNAISALVAHDARGARRMIALLSGLLRQTLTFGDRQEISLREELEVLDNYLDIESCRFQERLHVQRNIDATSLEAAVPSLLLQPIVENAMVHGFDPRDGSCRIEISTHRIGARLQLVIRDHGPGPGHKRPVTDNARIGLQNVRTRIARMHQGAGSFALQPAEGGGAKAIVDLPFRRIEPLVGAARQADHHEVPSRIDRR